MSQWVNDKSSMIYVVYGWSMSLVGTIDYPSTAGRNLSAQSTVDYILQSAMTIE